MHVNDKERPISKGAETKTDSVKKQEGPFDRFQRLMRDFSVGIDAIQKLGKSSSNNISINNTTVNSSSVTKPVHGFDHSKNYVYNAVANNTLAKGTTEKHFGITNNNNTVDKTIRMSGVAPRLNVNDKAKITAPTFPAVTGADKEAVRHMSGNVIQGSAEELPSAARLAQIMRVNELIKAGEIQPNSKIQAMAALIEQGKYRDVADTDPEKIQNIIHTAIGGKTKADQLLNTPSINRIVERYNTFTNNVHSSRSERTPSTNQSTHNTIENKHVDKHEAAFAYENKHIDKHESALTNMVDGNEIQHINAVDSHQRHTTNNHGGSSGSVAVSTTNNSSNEKIRELSAITKNDKTTNTSKERTLASKISGPPKPTYKDNSAETAEKGKGKNGRMEIRGTMNLVGNNGQSIGKANMDGELI